MTSEGDVSPRSCFVKGMSTPDTSKPRHAADSSDVSSVVPHAWKPLDILTAPADTFPAVDKDPMGGNPAFCSEGEKTGLADSLGSLIVVKYWN